MKQESKNNSVSRYKKPMLETSVFFMCKNQNERVLQEKIKGRISILIYLFFVSKKMIKPEKLILYLLFFVAFVLIFFHMISVSFPGE